MAIRTYFGFDPNTRKIFLNDITGDNSGGIQWFIGGESFDFSDIKDDNTKIGQFLLLCGGLEPDAVADMAALSQDATKLNTVVASPMAAEAIIRSATALKYICDNDATGGGLAKLASNIAGDRCDKWESHARSLVLDATLDASALFNKTSIEERNFNGNGTDYRGTNICILTQAHHLNSITAGKTGCFYAGDSFSRNGGFADPDTDEAQGNIIYFGGFQATTSAASASIGYEATKYETA